MQKAALFYYKQYDTLQKAYDQQAHLKKLFELDKKYQVAQQKHLVTLHEKELERKNFIIYLILTAAIILILFLLFSYITLIYQRQKKESILQFQYAKKLLQNTEQEQERIAGELHDGVTHELIALKSLWAQGALESGTKIDQIINEIRRMSRALHPVTLDKIGLKYTIAHLCDRYMEHEQLYVSYTIDYNKELDAAKELQVYRIVQEALTNVEKHAHAHAAKVSIHCKKNAVLVTIQDNGKGFNVQEKLSGAHAFGLHSIVERSKAIEGKTQITSSPTTGTRIQIEIPLQS